ncbi:MAG: PdaC/SigV domain-containing protein [Luteimonas sp.]
MLSMLFALVACQREAPAPETTPPSPINAPAPAPTAAPMELKDVIERDPRYLVGITYPKNLSRYPGLVAQLQRYAEAARGELKQAVDGLGSDKPSAPYDLSLTFTTVVETPQIVAVAADGSTYTGGAHGNPLLARFVWLPQQDKPLEAAGLIVDKRGWRDISDYVREQLHAALSQRIDADDMEAAERAQTMQSALKMIDDGTGPDATNFEQFEPVISADGKISALRFVFAPYQVGPYSDGVQTVEVPASVLRPHLAPAYRDLFAGR